MKLFAVTPESLNATKNGHQGEDEGYCVENEEEFYIDSIRCGEYHVSVRRSRRRFHREVVVLHESQGRLQPRDICYTCKECCSHKEGVYGVHFIPEDPVHIFFHILSIEKQALDS